MKGMKTCFVVFYWWIPALNLQDEIPVLPLLGKCWNLGFLTNFLFGPFDPAFVDKNSLLQQPWG